MSDKPTSLDPPTVPPTTTVEEALGAVHPANPAMEIIRARMDPKTGKFLTRWDADPELAKTGLWLDIGGGEYMFLKPLFSAQFRDRLQKRMKPNKRALARDDEKANALERKLQQDTVVEVVYMRHGVDPFEFYEEECPQGYRAASVKSGDILEGPWGAYSVVELEGGRFILDQAIPTDGGLIEANQANRREMLEKDKFWQMVVNTGDQLETFRKEELEADLGN